jgi:undecaprenyl pyrophosphate phosphatase UppP
VPVSTWVPPVAAVVAAVVVGAVVATVVGAVVVAVVEAWVVGAAVVVAAVVVEAVVVAIVVAFGVKKEQAERIRHAQIKRRNKIFLIGGHISIHPVMSVHCAYQTKTSSVRNNNLAFLSPIELIGLGFVINSTTD